MKPITPKELPKILDEGTIHILAQMADETPQSKEWHEVVDLLSNEDFRKEMDKGIEIQNALEKARKDSMTPKEKQKEADKLKAYMADPAPKFHGNMGEPETPQEFKNKYGQYTPGYDDKGSKINK